MRFLQLSLLAHASRPMASVGQPVTWALGLGSMGRLTGATFPRVSGFFPFHTGLIYVCIRRNMNALQKTWKIEKRRNFQL